MTNQKKMQIAALNAQGKSIEEISELSGVNAADVEAFLATRGAAPAVNREETAPEAKTRTYNRMTPTLLEKAKELRREGLSCAKIADQLSINRKTVEYHLRKAKTEQIEKEPAPVAADTDSEVRNSPNISTSDSTTKMTESQALEAAKKKLLEIYETLTPEECRAWELGEVYAEVVRGCG